MTTIAYRDGVIASDSQGTYAEVRCGSVAKIVRCKNGWIAGAAGNAPDCWLFLEWVMEGRPGRFEALQDKEDFCGLLVSPGGDVVRVSSSGTMYPLHGDFHALGSGAPIAFGAMAAGATAIKAVAIAIEFDAWSGGLVRSESL